MSVTRTKYITAIPLFFCLLLIFLTGCSRSVSSQNENHAPVQQEKFDQTAANEAIQKAIQKVQPTPITATPVTSVEAASQIINHFFNSLMPIVKSTEGDCTQMGSALLELLDSSKSDLLGAFKFIKTLENDPEKSKQFKEIMAKTSADTTEFASLTESCKNERNMRAFSLGFMALMLQTNQP